ncbi:MAG: hypothetical protein ACE5HI_13890 [bacterium]
MAYDDETTKTTSTTSTTPTDINTDNEEAEKLTLHPINETELRSMLGAKDILIRQMELKIGDLFNRLMQASKEIKQLKIKSEHRHIKEVKS